MTEGQKMDRPRFDPTINYGHIFQAITLAMGLISAAMYVSSEARETRLQIANLVKRVDSNDVRIAATSDAITQVREGANLTAERLQNLGPVISSIRDQNTRVSEQLGNIREDVASVKATIKGRYKSVE